QAKTDAEVVLDMETGFARSAMDPIARRDPKNLNNKMSLAQVKSLAPSFDFDRYLKSVSAPASPHYLVTSPAFFKGVEESLQKHPLDHWKVYLRWYLIQGSTSALGKQFVDESFDFFGRTLVGAKE